MTALSIILDIVLILVSIVLIAAVLMQQGQRQGLGAISGGAETFFGKSKARGLDAKLAKITKICAVVFIVLAIATTIIVTHNGNSTKTADLDTVITEAVDAAQDAANEEAAAVEADGTEDVSEETAEETAAN